jgi:hypothetical protein
MLGQEISSGVTLFHTHGKRPATFLDNKILDKVIQHTWLSIGRHVRHFELNRILEKKIVNFSTHLNVQNTF